MTPPAPPMPTEEQAYTLPEFIRTTLPCCGHVTRFPFMRTATRVYRRTCRGPCRRRWLVVVRPLRDLLEGLYGAVHAVEWTPAP